MGGMLRGKRVRRRGILRSSMREGVGMPCGTQGGFGFVYVTGDGATGDFAIGRWAPLAMSPRGLETK